MASGAIAMTVLKVAGTMMAAKTAIDGIKEGNLLKAVVGGAGAYFGVSSLASQAAGAATSGAAAATQGSAEIAGAATQNASEMVAQDIAGQAAGDVVGSVAGDVAGNVAGSQASMLASQNAGLLGAEEAAASLSEVMAGGSTPFQVSADMASNINTFANTPANPITGTVSKSSAWVDPVNNLNPANAITDASGSAITDASKGMSGWDKFLDDPMAWSKQNQGLLQAGVGVAQVGAGMINGKMQADAYNDKLRLEEEAIAREEAELARRRANLNSVARLRTPSIQKIYGV